MSHIALSYSRLSQYELCPLKFKHQYITKTYPDDSDNYFFKKGQRKHEQLENRILCLLNPNKVPLNYDEDVEACFPLIDNIIAQFPHIKTEMKITISKKFKSIDWFSKTAMYRAILDLLAIRDSEALILDWKTGKFRDYDNSPTGQLNLSSLLLFTIRPEIDIINNTYIFIDSKQKILKTFTRDQYEDLKAPFIESFKKVNEDTKFEPKVNEYCKYCLLEKDQCPLK